MKKLLFLCTQQICVQSLSQVLLCDSTRQVNDYGHSINRYSFQTIPFRMLEVFTSEEQIGLHIDSPLVVRSFLEDIYSYLVKRNYFQLVYQMLEEKVPPLDGISTVPPNAISDTLLQLIIQPLKLVNSCTGCSMLILSSFTEQILAPPFTEPIRFFIVPCLAAYDRFPYLYLVKYLASVLTTESSVNNSLMSSSFLLNGFMKLDRLHLEKVATVEYLGDYIRIISALSTNLNKLPRSVDVTVFKNDESSDSDSDDKEMADLSETVERETLLEVVNMLNEPACARMIVDAVEQLYLDDVDILHSLCKICHQLMMYNRSAIFDHR